MPLKWHIPTGCLYDLLSVEEGEYPWCLTVSEGHNPVFACRSLRPPTDPLPLPLLTRVLRFTSGPIQQMSCNRCPGRGICKRAT